MDRDLTRYLLEGARATPQPTPRRAEPSATPPPRTTRVNDRAEDLVYAGAWRERDPCPEDDDEGEDTEFAADRDHYEDDGPDDGAVYLPLGGGR
ncbi:hypothetical protein [Streptomyces sp. NPDC058401]|uniref:hypothetical protein n=1 Tax=Streptomyces sp. NPDC058401 TaxID=3346480 RepID=UPI003662253E